MMVCTLRAMGLILDIMRAAPMPQQHVMMKLEMSWSSRVQQLPYFGGMAKQHYWTRGDDERQRLYLHECDDLCPALVSQQLLKSNPMCSGVHDRRPRS